MRALDSMIAHALILSGGVTWDRLSFGIWMTL
jgi:hypothetical protein